ncbi:hypothetical protein ACNI3K_02290 [Demequina sp. SO4-13]|uniref:hypothetical protein n=1 Tax=Demequina sp. SO4-13 TaxID=3401027 RepID=UPI003AF51D12
MDRLESMMAQSVNADAAGLDGEAFTARHGDTVSGRVRRKRRGRAAGGAVAGLGAVGAVALAVPMLGSPGTVPATPLATPSSSAKACLTETVFDDIDPGAYWDVMYPTPQATGAGQSRFVAMANTATTFEYDPDRPYTSTYYIWDVQRQAYLMSVTLDSAAAATVTLADGTEMAIDPTADEQGADQAVAVEWTDVGRFSIDFGSSGDTFSYRTVDSAQTSDLRPADMLDASVTSTPPCPWAHPAATTEPPPGPPGSASPTPEPSSRWDSGIEPVPRATPVPEWRAPSPPPESLIPD